MNPDRSYGGIFESGGLFEDGVHLSEIIGGGGLYDGGLVESLRYAKIA